MPLRYDKPEDTCNVGDQTAPKISRSISFLRSRKSKDLSETSLTDNSSGGADVTPPMSGRTMSDVSGGSNDSSSFARPRIQQQCRQPNNKQTQSDQMLNLNSSGHKKVEEEGPPLRQRQHSTESCERTKKTSIEPEESTRTNVAIAEEHSLINDQAGFAAIDTQYDTDEHQVYIPEPEEEIYQARSQLNGLRSEVRRGVNSSRQYEDCRRHGDTPRRSLSQPPSLSRYYEHDRRNDPQSRSSVSSQQRGLGRIEEQWSEKNAGVSTGSMHDRSFTLERGDYTDVGSQHRQYGRAVSQISIPSEDTFSQYSQCQDLPNQSVGARKQFLTIFMYPNQSREGFSFHVEGGGHEKKFVKLANALTYASHYGYSSRDLEAENSFHDLFRRLTGHDESPLYVILTKVSGGGSGSGGSVNHGSGNNNGNNGRRTVDRIPSNVSMGSNGGGSQSGDHRT
mmetsp:Transcript_25242/g.58309  ORF Transcript_25242/g.58309 Transcript_25242/m.58309 type:complete len:451 (-) Transcript_25242:148-1500(-)|eukprot:CAMPEP_0113321994 /NCGR_PEP_ID=MMETSP0010_2-20120614/15294_1 /TAXON_ID=216773 ORGANISM="Corethron hystrix, Strain 308" /NCGR_SAMPLE_ID=MMETSP0010_2 /ASSEMBLY_ACC=CAM_ASM_000155 /LENGTH=450 /DNA_ID=CAMNT_0000180315 /DNA_START=57 /DNA_END=1409 /DNA_ORIENTATION=- /assembly_acc=CAM_ASM_000155